MLLNSREFYDSQSLRVNSFDELKFGINSCVLKAWNENITLFFDEGMLWTAPFKNQNFNILSNSERKFSFVLFPGRFRRKL